MINFQIQNSDEKYDKLARPPNSPNIPYSKYLKYSKGHQSCCLWPRRILLRVANAFGHTDTDTDTDTESGFYLNLFQLLNALGTELNFVIILTDVNNLAIIATDVNIILIISRVIIVIFILIIMLSKPGYFGKIPTCDQQYHYSIHQQRILSISYIF